MRQQEMLVLSSKDRDRLKVLHEVERKHLTRREAALQLGLSEWSVRKLVGRIRQEGDRGMDDATSAAAARFLGHDSTEENPRLLWSYLNRFGRAERRLDGAVKV